MKRSTLLMVFVGGVLTAFLTSLVIDWSGTAQEAPADPRPGLRMSPDELKEQFDSSMGVRSGRRLVPRSWPEGARAAVVVAYDANGGVGSLVEGDLVLNSMQQSEMGIRDGMRRILQLHDKHDIPGSFFVPAMSTVLYPDLLPSILASGRHEIGLHGWMHESYNELSEEEQRRLLGQAMDYLEEATGKRPVGFVPPGSRTHHTTYRVARDLGVKYIKSYASDDPHELIFPDEEGPSGLYGAPGDWALNDNTYTVSRGSLADPDGLFALWQDEFDVTYEEGALLVVTMHPPVSGRRAVYPYLDRFFGHMRAKGDVWFATGEQVVDYLTSLPADQFVE